MLKIPARNLEPVQLRLLTLIYKVQKGRMYSQNKSRKKPGPSQSQPQATANPLKLLQVINKSQDN